jgi:ligand-binding sensor domain-containing protein
MFKKLVASLYIVYSCCAICLARDEQQFFHISLEQGLSDGRVRAIAQDRYGFIWFGTANGLNRYDGYAIKAYFEGSRGLPSASIYSLYRSRAGQLWVGTSKGPYIYDHTSDSFYMPKPIDTSALAREWYVISYFSEDHDGNIYIGSYRGFFRYNTKQHKLEDLNRIWNTPHGLSMISGLSWSNDHTLWVATQNFGFYKIDTRSNQATPIRYKTEFGDSCCFAMNEIALLDQKKMLVGMHSYGLGLFDMDSLKFSTVPGILGKSDSVRYNAVYAVIKDHSGRVWMGTEHFGLVQYMPATRQTIQYKYDPFNPYSYGGSRVLNLFEDREHNIWVATNGYGVYRFNPDHNLVKFLAWNPLSDHSPPGAEVLSIGAHDSTSVWIGTDKGPALYYFNKDSFKSYKANNSFSPEKPGMNVISCFQDMDRMLWFGCRNLGLSRFDPVKNQFSRFRDDAKKPYALPNNLAYNIIQHDKQYLIIQLSTRIGLFDTKTYQCHTYKTDSSNELLKLNFVKDYCFDEHRDLLILQQDSKKTVLRYEFQSGKVTTVGYLDTSDKVSANSIRPMPDGRIACATTQGIYLMQPNGRVNILRNEEGFFRNNILSIITDIPGYIWLCTDRQIGRIELATGKWQWLGAGDGLKPTRFFAQSLRLLPNGKIMAGSGDGIFIIDPSQLHSAPTYPPYLVNFRIFNTPARFDTALQDLKEIRLSYLENFFSFDISSLDYLQGSGIEYAYKLEGFDKDWQYLGNNHSASYTNVPGGKYTLLFKARSATGDWVVSPQQIHVIIGRPFWLKWWFFVLCAAAVVVFVYILYRYRFNQVRNTARLKADYEIKLNELEMSALRTQMNPHFIFNCLNTINSFINSNQKTQANQYITRFARLIRLILENSRQRRIALSSELEALNLYIQLEQLRFDNRFTYTLITDDALDLDNVEVPPLIIQPFVENAILHGILPKKDKGNITIRIIHDGNRLRYIIADDGIGREEARRRQKEGMLKKQSHGMDITLKRIELFNKENAFEETVIIKDLTDTQGNAAGTSVEILLAYVEGF